MQDFKEYKIGAFGLSFFSFFFVHFNILKCWKKPTCDLNKDTVLIKSQDIFCSACECVVSAIQVIDILDTHYTSHGFQFHQLRLSKHTMQVGLLQLSNPP